VCQWLCGCWSISLNLSICGIRGVQESVGTAAAALPALWTMPAPQPTTTRYWWRPIGMETQQTQPCFLLADCCCRVQSVIFMVGGSAQCHWVVTVVASTWCCHSKPPKIRLLLLNMVKQGAEDDDHGDGSAVNKRRTVTRNGPDKWRRTQPFRYMLWLNDCTHSILTSSVKCGVRHGWSVASCCVLRCSESRLEKQGAICVRANVV